MASAMRPPNRMRLPANVVDADWLGDAIGYGDSDPDQLEPEAKVRLRAFQQAVDEAHASHRLKRLVVRDAKTGVVMGYAYRRADLEQLMLHPGSTELQRILDAVPEPGNPAQGKARK